MVKDMSSGSDILSMSERSLADTRSELEAVAAKSERLTAQLEHLRQAEVGALGVLARLRLREIESGELADALDDTGRLVQELLAQRADAQAALGTRLTAEQQALAALELERAAQHGVVDDAAKAVDAAEAAAQQQLAADAAYKERLDTAQGSDRVAVVAEQKAQAARTDRAEKGKPYETDPLFTYLWARGYGTPTYRAFGFTRLLDRWVARVCGYEPLRRNYWMLSERPARFDEHAKRMRAAADDDIGAVRALELVAAEAAGVPARELTLVETQEALAGIDKKIDERVTEINGLVDARGRFASGEDEHSLRCTELLSETFRREKMKTLRERATRTAR